MLSNCGNDEPDPTAPAFIEKARAYVRQNYIWSAITEYKNAIHLDPENDTAYFELAETNVLLYSIHEAIMAYQKALTINPKNKYAKLRLGQIYLTTGKLLGASEIISAILATAPQTIEAYHLLSSIQIREKNFDAAIGTLQKAMLIPEKNFKTTLALASLYKASSKQHLAETAYKAALAIDPSRRGPYMELCKLYRKDKAWDKMEALLLQFLETPGIKEVKLTDLAHFYEGQKKYSTAETYYNRAADESPHSIQALMNLAEFQTRRGDRGNAIATMEKAVKLEPENPLCLVGLAQVYFAFDMPELSRGYIDKALALDEYNLEALFTIGKLLMKRGDFKGAYDHIAWVIDQGFKNAEAYLLRALCRKHKALQEGQKQVTIRAGAERLYKPEVYWQRKMKKDLQAALLIEPDMLKSRIELIEIYLYEEDTTKADKHLGYAILQSPRNPRLLIQLAALKILQGDSDEAIEIYTAIVEQNPSYLPGHLRLALLYTTSGQINQALLSYLIAYEIDPQRTPILKQISDILVSKKRYKKAMALLNSTKIPKDKISQAFVENLRGEISVKAGDEPRAINSFQAAIAMDPTAIAPKINMARLFMDRKQIEKAKIIYMEVERAKPDHLAMLMALGFIHAHQGDLKVAESYCRRVLAIDANHGYASNNLAILLTEANGATHKALRLTAIALDKHPNDPTVLDNMGWLLFQKGYYHFAILFIKDSLALKPENPLACYHMGMALYRTNKLLESRQYFKKAISFGHDFKHAEEAREMLRRPQAIDDVDLGDGRSLAGLIPDPDNGAGGNDFDLNNIGLFINDRRLLQDSQLFFALDTGSALPPGEYGDGIPGRQIQKGNPVVNFGGDGTYEFTFQFNSPSSSNNIPHTFIDSAENKATYKVEKKVFSVDNSGPLRNDGWPTAQYYSSNNLEPWQPLSIASTPLAAVTAYYTRDTNPNDNLKSERGIQRYGQSFLEAVEQQRLAICKGFLSVITTLPEEILQQFPNDHDYLLKATIYALSDYRGFAGPTDEPNRLALDRRALSSA